MAVRNLGHRVEAVLVVGAKNSSNSNRLVEVAQRGGTAAYLIAEAREIHPEWVNGLRNVAVTAGASAPEILVQQVVSRLKELGFNRVEEVDWIEENVSFVLPPEFRADRSLIRFGEAYAAE
jgi:4-hydroxy-3-methylbut-2-enyl diphosphate reductase